MKNNLLVMFAATSALAANAVLSAPIAAVDVSDVVTTISNQLTPIGAVGAGVIMLIVAVKAYKWIRRAF